RNRGIGNAQALQAAIEAQCDLEGVFLELQSEELVLKDDRHLFGIGLTQALRQRDAGMSRTEGDVEMMIARHTVASDPGEDRADDAAKGILNDLFVSQQILAHTLSAKPAAGARVGGFCCPVPPEPRLLLMQQQRVRRYRSHLEIG